MIKISKNLKEEIKNNVLKYEELKEIVECFAFSYNTVDYNLIISRGNNKKLSECRKGLGGEYDKKLYISEVNEKKVFITKAKNNNSYIRLSTFTERQGKTFVKEKEDYKNGKN